MGTLWIPGAERLPCSKPGGVITSTAPPRAVWHTTEAQPGTAAVWASMIRVLNSKSAEPQILYDPLTDRLGQFMPLNLSGRALKNDGTYQTNRTGRVCIQIEVIAYAAKPFTDYWKPDKNFKAMIAALKSWGIAVDSWPAGPPPRFVNSPPHNVPESPRSRPTWLAKGGYYSHSQVPGNNHGDPGGVDVLDLKAAGKPAATPTPPVEDEMTLDELKAYMRDLYNPESGSAGQFQTRMTARLDAIEARLNALDSEVAKAVWDEQIPDVLTPESGDTAAARTHLTWMPKRVADAIKPPTEV